MDSMIASTSTYGWELLAQLAVWGQLGAVSADAPTCAGELADLLARHLPMPIGRVEIVERGVILGSATWGHASTGELSSLNICSNGEEIGRLYLGGSATVALDPNVAAALTAQLALLLATRRRESEIAVMDHLRALITSNLGLVGVLDVRTLLGVVLTDALPILNVESAGLYSGDDGAQTLALAATSADADGYPQLIARDSHDLPARAAAEGQRLLGSALVATSRRRGTASTAPAAERPALAMPILAHAQPTGVLVIALHRNLPEPGDHQLHIIESFAAQVTLLLRNARLFSQQQQRARELFVLYENSKEISADAQIESTLDRTTENIALALDAEYCAVRLIDPQRPAILRTVAIYADAGRAQVAASEITLVNAPAVLAQISRGEPLQIEDVSASALANPLAAALAAEGYRSALLLPLRTKDQTIGLLSIGYERARRPVTQAERNLAQVLAAQVSTAIANRRLYEVEQRRAAELELLQRISQRLSAGLSLDETLDAILNGLQSLASFGGARIALWDGHTRELQMATSCGLQAPAGSVADSLSNWLARIQRPRLIPDMESLAAQGGAPRQVAQIILEDGSVARSYVGLPMRTGDTLIGVLELFAAAPNAFSTDNERLLRIIADQSAQVIVNATRYEQADSSLRSRLEQMRALQRVSSQLAITLNQKEILAYALEQALKATGASHGLIALRAVTEDSGEGDDVAVCRIVEAVGYDEQTQAALIDTVLDTRITTAHTAMQRGEPELSDTISSGERDAIHLPDVGTALAAPIFYQAGVAGVLLLLSPKPHGFDHNAVDFLRTLTHQAAVGIGNAQRYAELEHLSRMFQRRASMLNDVLEIGQALRADRSLENLLEQVGYSATDSANFRTIVFCLADPDNVHVLRPVAAAGIPLNELDQMGRRPLPEALATRYLDSRFRVGHSYFVPAAEAAALERGFNTSVFSYTSFDDTRLPDEWQRDDRLLVPLYSTEGNLLGLMFAGDPQDRQRPTARTVEPLEIFADQSAIAIENYYLLREARARAEQLGLLNRVSALAATETEVQKIYQSIVGAMAEATGVDQARLVIYDRKAGHGTAVAELVPSDAMDTITISLDDNPLVAWLDTNKTSFVSADAQHDPILIRSHKIFREMDVRTIALIPLVMDNAVIGGIGLDFVGRAGEFRPQALDLCQTIANQITTAIARTQAFAAANRSADALGVKVGELSTLLDAARILSSLLQPEEVLSKLMELVSRQLNVTTVALWTIAEEGSVLLPAALDGIPTERGRSMRVPVGQGHTGRVAESGTPLIIDDVRVSGGSLYPRYERDNNLISFMGVPVVYRERTVGVLSVMTNYLRRFSDDEKLLLVGLADQAAAAMENARLFQERERRISELSTINAISEAVNSTLEQHDLLERLHRGIGEILDVSTSRIGMYNNQTGVLSYPIAYDSQQHIELPAMTLAEANGPNGWVLRNHQPLLIHSADEARARNLYGEAKDHRIPELQVQSFLVVPIIFGSKVIGVISLQSYEPRAFDENGLRFLTTVANQAAVAINNATLFSETRQNAQEMTTLFEVTQNLSGTLDPNETQLLVADSALRLIGVEMCAVLRFDSHGQLGKPLLMHRGVVVNDLHLGFRLSGMTGQLLQRDQPLAISDLAAFDRSTVINPQVLEIGICSALGVVIGAHDERMGVLWVGSRTHIDWSDHQISLISILANQASQALKSAQLFQLEQQRRRLADTLRDVAQSFTSTLALREIQTLILDQLARVVRYDSAAVLLRDAGYGHLHITEARGIAGSQLLNVDFDVQEIALFQTMALERKPLMLANTQDDPRFAVLRQLGWDAHSWIGAPLLVDNELVGLLTVGTDSADAYDYEDVEVTFALASQASQAIQNARLFDQISNLAADLERRVSERTAELEQATRQVSEEKDRLEAVHTITLELTTQLDLDSVIQRALELISENLGVAHGSIMLRDTEDGELICRAVLYERGDVHGAHIPLAFSGSESLASWVMRYQESVNIADVRIDARWVRVPGRADDVRSVAGVPLKTSDAALGVLILSSPIVGYFTDSQMSLLGTITSVVASAVSNAQLYSFITELATRNAVLLEEQREESSKSAAVFRSVTEGVIVLDTNGNVTLFNPAAEQVLEVPSAVLLRQPIRTLAEYGGDDTQRKRAQTIYNGLMNGLKQVRQSQGIYITSLDLTNPSQVIALNIAPVIGPGDQRYGDVMVLRDITREIEADEAKRQFISDVSHELRTPLTAIKGYVDVLLLSGTQSLSADQVSYLGIIKNNTNRLKSLIEDILEFSRPDSSKRLNFAQLAIPDVINEVVQALRLEYERKSMTVLLDMPVGLPHVMADQKRITQVVFNLFSNAVKYTFEGGRIHVRVFLNRANMMQVDVEDTGVGMSPDQRKKLFRPFYRADNPLRDVAGGTGLGLSIAKALIEQHGGEMWVTSEIGRGSTFSFIIPLEQTEPSAEEDAS